MTLAVQRFQALLKIDQPMTTPNCAPIEAAPVVGNDDFEAIFGLGYLQLHFRCRSMADHIVQGFFDSKEQAVPRGSCQRDRAALDWNFEAAKDA